VYKYTPLGSNGGGAFDRKKQKNPYENRTPIAERVAGKGEKNPRENKGWKEGKMTFGHLRETRAIKVANVSLSLARTLPLLCPLVERSVRSGMGGGICSEIMES